MIPLPRVLLIGSMTEPKYHPLQAMMDEIAAIFGDEIRLDITEDYDALRKERLRVYDLCICYADTWDVRHDRERIAGLLSWLSEGGGLLVIHNGISLQTHHEFRQAVGARFTGHPPYTKLDFVPAAAEHEIMRGITGFAMEEEPYRFDMDPLGETEILLEYVHEQAKWPAAWAHEYGLGRIAYLMPGHHAASFHHPVYRRLIRQAGMWAMRAHGNEGGSR